MVLVAPGPGIYSEVGSWGGRGDWGGCVGVGLWVIRECSWFQLFLSW